MTRQHVIFLFALAALLGSSLATWATIQERNYQLRGYVNPTQTALLPFRIPRLGVNVELIQYTEEELDWHLDRMRDAHVTWVRQMVRWDEIEPERGQYRWENWDSIVNALNRYPDLRLIAVLVNTPCWARQSDTSTAVTTPPADPAEYADFVYAFAQRYGQSVDYYQVWDEPNLSDAWGGLEPHPTEYAALLQAAYRAIHAADKDANVIAAALAPTIETGPENISDIHFLRNLYALGAQEYTDAIAAKPFGFNASPLDRTVEPNVLNFSRIVALREVMVENNDGAKPLWASSVAWNSLPTNWTGAPSIWSNVSSQEQVNYTLAALDRADREWPWLAGFVLFHWQPDTDLDDPLWGFALIDAENQPTALWAALAEREPTTTAQNGLFAAINPYARYSGVWRFGELGADVGWLDDSQLDFNFVGQEIALLLRQGDYVAYLYPTVDGQQANATPHDTSGNAYILLTSNSREPELELVPVARNLSNQRHTLHIVADRGQQQWALVGFAVSSGDLAAPYNRQTAAALFTMAVAALSVLAAGWQLNWKTMIAPITAYWQRLTATGQLAFSAVTSIALMVGMLLTWGDATPNFLRRESVQLGIAILSAGLIYIQPGLALTLAAAFMLFAIFYHRADFGLTLTVFWAPFFLFPVELYQFAFPMAEILILLTFSAWLLRLIVDWGRSRQRAVSQFPASSATTRLLRLKRIDYGIIVWLFLGIVSLSWSERVPQALTEMRVMIVEPTVFYLIFRTSITDKQRAVRVVDAMLLAGLFVAVIGLWLYLQDEAVITAEAGARRLASVYGSPNNVALFLGRCLPFALAYLLLSPNRIRQVVSGVGLAAMLLAILLSQSAGAIFLGVPVAAAAVVLIAGHRRARWALVAMLGGIAVISPFLLQSARFARLFDFSSGTNFFRIRVWQSAINILHDHPLTGIGLDQFLYAYRGQYVMPDAWQEPNLSHPHNFMLDFWVRLGIFGVLNFVWLQVAFWRAMLYAYRRVRELDPMYFALAVGAMGSMMNLLAHGLVDNSIYVHDLAYVYTLLLGLAVHLSNIRPIDDSE